MPSWHGAQLKHRDNFNFNVICNFKVKVGKLNTKE
jgi:hypothetical protein